MRDSTGEGEKRGTFSKVSKSTSQVKVQLLVCPSNSSKEVKKLAVEVGVFKDTLITVIEMIEGLRPN